jgi:ATP:ADP antiporter, AAA family
VTATKSSNGSINNGGRAYRAADKIGAWSVALLRWAGVALVVIPIAVLWLANALWLGRRQEQLGARQEMSPDSAPGHGASQ